MSIILFMSGEWLRLNNGFSRLEEGGGSYSRSDAPGLDMQSQMYSFQAAEYAKQQVDELDSYLDERFDGGVESFFIYGSTGEGTAVKDSSDVDIMILLEYPDGDLDEISDKDPFFAVEDYIDHASEKFYEGNNGSFEPALDPQSALYDDVLGRLKTQEEDVRKGKPSSQLEEVILTGAGGSGNDLDKPYPDFMRTLWQGSISHSEYFSEEFGEVVENGFEIITEGDRLRTDIDWDGRDVPYNYGPEPMNPEEGSRNGDKDARARQLRRMAQRGKKEEPEQQASEMEEREQSTFHNFGGKSLEEIQPEQKTFDAFN